MLTKLKVIKKGRFLSLIAGAVFLSACASKPVTSGIGSTEMIDGNQFQHHLLVDNPELGEQLVITNVKTRKTNNLLEINVTLNSKYEKTQNLQYHFNWFDEQGFVIAPEKNNWIPLALHGAQLVSLRGLAPTEKVASFSVYVREVPEKAYRF